jgi:hypothetical protein
MQEQEMTITPTPRTRRPLSARIALISAVSLGLVAGPVAFAGPATAMPSHSKRADCTVTALDPYAANSHGRNAVRDDPRNKDRKSVKVSFPFRIHCDKDAQVRYNQKMFQKHGRWNAEEIGSAWDTVWVSGHDRIVNMETVKADRGDKFVKVFHTVRIQVQDKDRSDHRSRSSDFDRSATVTIWVSNNHK